MVTIDIVWALLIGYLFGSLPTSYILCKVLLKGLDIRTVGSGNVGGRNLIRALKENNKPGFIAYTAGILVAIFDLGKGYFAMWLTQYISFKIGSEDPWVICFAAVFAVLGHNWPIWLRSAGGKGVATAVGVLVFFNPIYWAIWIVAFILIASIVMFSSIAYLLDFIVMGVLMYFWHWYVTPTAFDPLTLDPSFGTIGLVTTIFVTLVMLTRQGENFKKIKNGEAKKMRIWKIFVGKFDEVLK